MTAVASSRKAALLVALIAAIAVRSIYAMPVAVTAHLKAVECCSRHCDGGRHGHQADRCCGVASTATDSATVGSGMPIQPTMAVSTAPDGDLAIPSTGSTRVNVVASEASKGRVFVRLRSLRL